MKEDPSPLDLLLRAHKAENGDHQHPTDFARAGALWQQLRSIGSHYAHQRLERLLHNGIISPRDLHPSKGTYASSDMLDEVPKPPPERTAFDRAHNPTADQYRPEVMVVDDGEDTRRIISYMLERDGYHAVMASDGLDGLVKAMHHPETAAMLVDLNMPQMNGLEFIQTLRQENAFQKVPIIIITAHNNRDLVNRAKELGVTAWITKPVTRDKLLQTMNKVLPIATTQQREHP